MSRNMEHGAKAFSVRMAFACFRYALGGKDADWSVDECITWLRLVTGERP